MKKTFLAKRNALLSFANISWGSLALALAVLALLMRLLVPNFFWRMTAPVFRIADSAAAQSHAFFASFTAATILTLQNEKLLNENAALANENQALLQKVAGQGALSKQSTKNIIAGVIARPPASPYDTLVLSGGDTSGISLGQEVFGAGGVPLGVVSAVLPDFSRVALFSTPGMVVQGWVGRSNIPLTIFGSGGGAMKASLARSAGVTVGDVVSVPGPGALPIGSVVRIDSDPSSPMVTLQIQPVLNLFSVTWVELRDTGAAFVRAFSWATSTLP